MLGDFRIEVPAIVRQKMNEIWYNIGKMAFVERVNIGSKCPVCLEFQIIGTRHHSCQAPVPTQFTCIVCLRDERVGNHTSCREQIVVMRENLIALFRGGSRK